MFRVVDCTLTSKNGKMTAVLTLSGTGYDYLYVGTSEQAAKADSSKWVPYTVNANGKYTYEIPVTSLDKGLAVAAFSHTNTKCCSNRHSNPTRNTEAPSYTGFKS